MGYRLWVSNGTTQSALDLTQLTETGQTIHLQVKLNQPISLSDTAACRQQLNLQIAGRTSESLCRVVSMAKNSSDNIILDITIQVDPNTQGVDSDSMAAQYNPALTMAAEAVLVGQGIFSTGTGNCFQPKAALTEAEAEAEAILAVVQTLLPEDGENTDPTGGMFWVGDNR